MKVDSTSTSSLSSPKGGVQGTRQGGQAAANAAPTGGSAASAQSAGGDANVSLSGLSSQLRSLAASGEADIDVAHVESIKQAIADGTLTMDPGKIADGILATARDLLKNPSTGG